MKDRTCKRCGKTFTPTHGRQVCCNVPIEVPCEVCGKPISQKCTTAWQKSTCSRTCEIELSNRGRKTSASKSYKVCKACGKEFIPKSARDLYCKGPHIRQCAVCGKDYEYNPKRKDAANTCSKECRYSLMNKNTDRDSSMKHLKETLIEKYGVDNPVKIPGVKEKMVTTTKERYGVEYYQQTEEYKQRYKQTSLEKYGVDHHLKSKKSHK